MGRSGIEARIPPHVRGIAQRRREGIGYDRGRQRGHRDATYGLDRVGVRRRERLRSSQAREQRTDPGTRLHLRPLDRSDPHRRRFFGRRRRRVHDEVSPRDRHRSELPRPTCSGGAPRPRGRGSILPRTLPDGGGHSSGGGQRGTEREEADRRRQQWQRRRRRSGIVVAAPQPSDVRRRGFYPERRSRGCRRRRTHRRGRGRRRRSPRQRRPHRAERRGLPQDERLRARRASRRGGLREYLGAGRRPATGQSHLVQRESHPSVPHQTVRSHSLLGRQDGARGTGGGVVHRVPPRRRGYRILQEREGPYRHAGYLQGRPIRAAIPRLFVRWETSEWRFHGRRRFPDDGGGVGRRVVDEDEGDATGDLREERRTGQVRLQRPSVQVHARGAQASPRDFGGIVQGAGEVDHAVLRTIAPPWWVFVDIIWASCEGGRVEGWWPWLVRSVAGAVVTDSVEMERRF
mmetsp:Transcript_22001/g.65117  ORF Transcript_22001/g.65117 Transcript_22001/m.65117 type:complete len:460 (+) Transcript_22001:3557-4936(+)